MMIYGELQHFKLLQTFWIYKRKPKQESNVCRLHLLGITVISFKKTLCRCEHFPSNLLHEPQISFHSKTERLTSQELVDKHKLCTMARTIMLHGWICIVCLILLIHSPFVLADQVGPTAETNRRISGKGYNGGPSLVLNTDYCSPWTHHQSLLSGDSWCSWKTSISL